MRTIFNLFFIFVSFYTFSQKNIVACLGKVVDDSVVTLVDEQAFVSKMNADFFEHKDYIQKMGIEKGVTKGDETIDFYYLKLYTNDKDYNRLLLLEDNYLYVIGTKPGEDYSIYDFYVHCEDTHEECGLRMFYVDNEYIWGCNENLGCVPDGNCRSTRSVF